MKILHRLSYLIVVPLTLFIVLLSVGIVYLISILNWIFTGKWIVEEIRTKFEKWYIDRFFELLEKYYPL